MDVYEEPVNLAQFARSPTYENNVARAPMPQSDRSRKRGPSSHSASSWVQPAVQKTSNPTKCRTKLPWVAFGCGFLLLLALIVVCVVLIAQVKQVKEVEIEGNSDVLAVRAKTHFADRMINETKQFLDFLISNANTTPEKEEAATSVNSLEIARLNISLRESKELIKVLCPFAYEDKCYIFMEREHGRFDLARSRCQNMGADLANIYSSQHMELLMHYIRNHTLGSRESVNFLLGMRYMQSNSTMISATGEHLLTDWKWRSGYPTNSSDFSGVLLRVDENSSESNQFLWTYKTPWLSPFRFYDYYDFICETPLK